MANESEIIQFLKMTNNELNTEGKIFRAAYDIFLLYGYHGTKLRQIASLAGVHTSVIHYYFRSKDRLYETVVSEMLDRMLNTKSASYIAAESLERPAWFLYTEHCNNRNLFENTVKHLHPEDWEIKLNDLKTRFEFRAKWGTSLLQNKTIRHQHPKKSLASKGNS